MKEFFPFSLIKLDIIVIPESFSTIPFNVVKVNPTSELLYYTYIFTTYCLIFSFNSYCLELWFSFIQQFLYVLSAV